MRGANGLKRTFEGVENRTLSLHVVKLVLELGVAVLSLGVSCQRTDEHRGHRCELTCTALVQLHKPAEL